LETYYLNVKNWAKILLIQFPSITSPYILCIDLFLRLCTYFNLQTATSTTKKNLMRPWIYDFEAYKKNKQRNTINSTIMKICANVVCDIGIVEQYKACCPCHFHNRQSCYLCYFIFSSELDMSVLSTSFKFGRLSSILLISFLFYNYNSNLLK